MNFGVGLGQNSQQFLNGIKHIFTILDYAFLCKVMISVLVIIKSKY